MCGGGAGGGTKVHHLDSEGEPLGIHKHDVLRLEVRVDYADLAQLHQTRQDLLQDGADVAERHRAKPGGLEVVVQVHVKELEHDADVAAVGEALVRVHKVMDAGVFASQSREDLYL